MATNGLSKKKNEKKELKVFQNKYAEDQFFKKLKKIAEKTKKRIHPFPFQNYQKRPKNILYEE